ncbi:MAG: uridine kinase [Bacteroidetes bacterium]|nr:MAG: uridine kinase [Bacteroidota bacterium]
MLLIGIAGGTGSGKTTVVKKLIAQLPKGEVTVLSQDSYYKDNSHLPLEERQKINFDHPNSIEWELLIEHIQKLKKKEPIEEPIYSYLTCTRDSKTKTVQPHKVIIIEGILILTNKLLRDLFDIKLFVYADDDDRLGRVIERDIAERGRTVKKVLDRYSNVVKPMHLQFIEPSKSFADLIIPQGGHNKVAIELISAIIEKHLNKSN